MAARKGVAAGWEAFCAIIPLFVPAISLFITVYFMDKGKKSSWYRSGLGLVVAILFLPFFTIWYAWYKSTWNKSIRLLTTVVCLLFIGFSLAIVNSTEIEEESSDKSENEVSTEAKVSEDEGMSESERKEIYNLIVTNEDKARDESDAKYPDDFQSNYDYKEELIESYKQEVLQLYGIDSDTYLGIIIEGVDKNW